MKRSVEESVEDAWRESNRGSSANDERRPEPQRPRLQFIPIGQILGKITPPQWLIRDFLELDSLVMVFGDPEAGKSFMAMDWAACVATGQAWKGNPVRQGPVLYINGEGRNGVSRRFTAWSIVNTSLSEAPLHFSSVTTALTDVMAAAELEVVIGEFIAEFGPPVLIVIDTLARNYGPGDENSTQDMTQAIATCDAIRELTHATVALVHHSGHGDKARARGAMAMRAALDAEYRMARIPESKNTSLECTKMKDGDKPAPMTFEFRSVELGIVDDYDRQVTSAILHPVAWEPPQQAAMPKAGRPGKYDGPVLDILHTLRSKAMANLSAQGRDPAEARISIDAWRDACTAKDIGRQRFHDARVRLVDAGSVVVEYGMAYPKEAK